MKSNRKKNLMRILMAGFGGKGGMYAYTDMVCTGLAQNGADVTVLATAESPNYEHGFNVVRNLLILNPSEKNWSKLHWAVDRFFKSFYNCMSRNSFAFRGNFDIVHVQVGSPLIDQYLIKHLARKIPTVLTVHDVKQHSRKFGTSESFLRRYYHAFDRLIVHYEDGKRQMEEIWGVPPEKVDVIAHGIMPLAREYDMMASRAKLGLEQDRKVILFFGGIRANKGLDVLLEAMELIKTNDDSVLLVIAGGLPRGESFESYQQIIERYNLENHVKKFVYFIDDSDVDDFFAASNVVVIPYLNFEAQSGVLLRAYAHKRIVVVSDVGAMGELVRKDKIGIAVEPENKELLSEAMIRILSDIDSFHAFYTQKLMEKYSLKNIGQQSVECYKKAINSKDLS